MELHERDNYDTRGRSEYFICKPVCSQSLVMIRPQMKCRHTALLAYRIIMNIRKGPVDVPDLRNIYGKTARVDEIVSILTISFIVSE